MTVTLQTNKQTSTHKLAHVCIGLKLPEMNVAVLVWLHTNSRRYIHTLLIGMHRLNTLHLKIQKYIPTVSKFTWLHLLL